MANDVKQPFKKGDKVENYLRGTTLPLGYRGIVEEATSGGYIRIVGCLGWHHSFLFRKVENETIIITTDGDVGKVKYLKGKKVIKEAKLIRQKEDKHDMKTMAAYAVQKLFPNDGNMIINVKAGYTGAVAVINSENPTYTDGKILEFVSGKCTTAMLPYAKEFNTLEDVKRCFKKDPYKFDVVELHRH